MCVCRQAKVCVQKGVENGVWHGVAGVAGRQVCKGKGKGVACVVCVCAKV